MEKGTAYSYLIKSIDKLKFYDIASISSDYILRLSEEQKKLLYDEIKSSRSSYCVNRNPCCNFKLPHTDAQFHAYMHENGVLTRRLYFDLLNEDVKDLHCSKDIAIIDYDCGIGLHTLSLIDYLKSTNNSHNIKEILLIEENLFCLERAELLVKSIIPSAQVRVINKTANSVSLEEIRLEHVLVYNIVCGNERRLDTRVIRNAFEGGRFLFSKLIRKKSTILTGNASSDPSYMSYFDSNGEYFICERFDFDTVHIADNEDSGNFYERLYKPSDVYGDIMPDDSYIHTMQLHGFTTSASICFRQTKDASDRSILAKLNYINCLRLGIGCDVNLEEAEALLKELKGSYNEKIRRIIIRLLSVCCKDVQECIQYAKEYLSFEITDAQKCATRCNLACWLQENDKEQAEILYRLCIEYGCKTCHEAHSYDESTKHCPRAQYLLSKLLENTSSKESVELLKESADQCYNPALNALGHYYLKSGETKENLSKAADLFIQAARLGSEVAPYWAFACLADLAPAKALWYLALACKYNSSYAKRDMIKMIPKVIYGKRCDQLVEEQIIQNAEDGMVEYKNRAVEILIKRIHAYENHDEYDEAFDVLNKLELIDLDIANHTREKLNKNLPDWYIEEECRYNNEVEYYSREDSLRDALDDDIGSYWNID